MMDFVKPKRLQRGDTVAVLSPSAGLPHMFPATYRKGVEELEAVFGVKVREMPTAMLPNAALHADPKRRADDLNAAFADPDVRAIITSIGGEDSVRILRYLDLDLVEDNPKIVMGYSDATTFLTYFNQHGLVTFNGPAVMAGLAQVRALPDAYIKHLLTLLMTDFDTYIYRAYPSYTERFLDWSNPENAGKIGELKPDPIGHQWVQGSGQTIGRLFGGCIEVLEFLKSTPYWPEASFWDGKILFFETSEETPPVNMVRYWLRNYGVQGIYDRIRGVLFGRARDYTTEGKHALVETIKQVIADEFGRPDLPVVANLDFGHTDPQWIMPNGALAEINCDAQHIRLLEAPTSG